MISLPILSDILISEYLQMQPSFFGKVIFAATIAIVLFNPSLGFPLIYEHLLIANVL